MYTQQLINEVAERLDLVDVVNEYVALTKKGKNYSACCPFHEEKTPSFTVDSKDQLYHCFGCGDGGNVFSFVQKFENIPFPAAVEKLAKKAGVELPTPEESTVESSEYRKAYSALQKAANVYQKNLSDNANPIAVQALKDRGVTDETIKKFGIGVAVDKWDDVTEQLGRWKAREALDISGVSVYKPKDEELGKKARLYDRFRNGIIFPIHNRAGNVVSFGRRQVTDDGSPKYINGVETIVFDKSSVMYGMYHAIADNESSLDRFIITEGYMDVVMSHQHGITETVAAMGTSVSESNIRSMLRQTPNLYFVLDGDSAGVDASVRSLASVLPCIDENASVNFVFLPSGEDPDSFIRKYGAGVYDAYIAKNAVPLSDFIVKLAQTGVDMDTREGRALFFSRATKHLDQMQPSPLKASIASEVSRISGIKIQEVLPISLNVLPKVDSIALAAKVTEVVERELKLEKGQLQVAFTPPKIQSTKIPVIQSFADRDAGKEYAERALAVQTALKLDTQVLEGFTLDSLYRTACQAQGGERSLARATIENYLTQSNAFEAQCKQIVINLRAIRDCIDEIQRCDQLTQDKATNISNWLEAVKTKFETFRGIGELSNDEYVKHVVKASGNSVNAICNGFISDLVAYQDELNKQPQDNSLNVKLTR